MSDEKSLKWEVLGWSAEWSQEEGCVVFRDHTSTPCQRGLVRETCPRFELHLAPSTARELAEFLVRVTESQPKPNSLALLLEWEGKQVEVVDRMKGILHYEGKTQGTYHCFTVRSFDGRSGSTFTLRHIQMMGYANDRDVDDQGNSLGPASDRWYPPKIWLTAKIKGPVPPF